MRRRNYETRSAAQSWNQASTNGTHSADTPQQPPVQINSLTGTYATSTYLAALKKSPKDLEALAKDIEQFDKKIKEDEKVAAFIRTSF